MQSRGVPRLMFLGTAWALVALAGLTAAVAQTAAPKLLPIPSEAARKQAQAGLREVYSDEYAGAKSPELKAALGAKLLAKAEQTTNDEASRFVLLAAARDLAVQAGQADAAFRAIDKMAERFVLDAGLAKAEVVGKLVPASTSAKQLVSLATLADELVDELCTADHFEQALEVLQTARDAAKDSKNIDLVKQLAVHTKQVEATNRAYQEIKPSLDALDKKAADPEANLAVGKYICFVKGDWDRGVPMLALGGDGALSKLARKDLEGTTNADDQAAIGDGWWKLAEEATGTAKRQLQARAAHWYQPALGQLSGLAKDAVAKRLAEIEQAKTMATLPKDAVRLAKGLVGAYLASASQRKTKELKAAAWEFRADGTLAEETRIVGNWTISESQLTIKFNDAMRASATIRLKKKEPYLGVVTFQDGETWNCELRRATVVASWMHSVPNTPPVKLRFWSNGYLDYPGGLATWIQKGTKLTLLWPNGDVDNCTLSNAGRSYTGQNQRGARVSGTLADQ